MKMRQGTMIICLLLLLGLALAAPQMAMAAFTPACTPIGNTASVAYSVGGFAQSPVSSNTNTFVVGNKVDLAVVTTDAAPGVSVVSNQTGAVLTFTITNNGNASQIYGLTAVEEVSGLTTSVFSGNNSVTDAFNAAGYATSAAKTAVISAGSSTTVTIIATMPAGLTNNTYAVYALVAQAFKVDGTTPEANGTSSITSAYGTCSADVVLGDVAGTDDAARDGRHSARSAYHAVLTNLMVSKSSVVYSDPVNGTAGAKAIPGAIMEYLVVINNPAGQSTATGVTVTDALTATVVPVTAAWTSVTAGGGSGCAGQARANIAGGGWACLATSSWSGQTLTATIPTLSTNTTATIVYQATVQ
jgi:hypothetical protein